MVKYIKFELENNKIVAESHRPIVKFNDEFSIGYFWNIDTDNQKLGTFYIHHGGVPRSQCYIYIVPIFYLTINAILVLAYWLIAIFTSSKVGAENFGL